ncbi:hypothetical protein [Fischerella thermalis]|uniref:hypothetical protein n=1 Tax=Fischerella thermalis TaxID=372787 RepID=UPI001A100D78|nr:hypothetical protein [Fischerella thermalis]MBF2060700.1 hypothetical protein [Fischerella thermalis M66_A2018_004]
MVIDNGLFGRSVNEGRNATGLLGCSVRRNERAIVASNKVASIIWLAIAQNRF